MFVGKNGKDKVSPVNFIMNPDQNPNWYTRVPAYSVYLYNVRKFGGSVRISKQQSSTPAIGKSSLQ